MRLAPGVLESRRLAKLDSRSPLERGVDGGWQGRWTWSPRAERERRRGTNGATVGARSPGTTTGPRAQRFGMTLCATEHIVCRPRILIAHTEDQETACSSLHARTLTHTPALERPHPYSAAPRPVMVSPTPLSSNVARKSSARDRLGQKGRPGPGDGRINRHRRRGASSGLAARRTAFARGLGDRGRIPWPLRGPAIESIGRTASLRRRRTRERVRNRPSRRAVPTSFGWPCAHGLTAPPPRGTPRGPR